MKVPKKLQLKQLIKQRWLIILSISLTIIIIGCFFLIRHHNPKNIAQTPINKDQAIPKAEAYLLKNKDTMDPTLRLILDFLQRKFDINNQFSGQVNHIETNADDPLAQNELKAIARIAYKDTLSNELGPNPSTTAIAANCDHIPLPADMSSLLQQEINRGTYDLTHAFLAMQFMKELDCTFSNSDALREQAITGMLSILNTEKSKLDLRYQSMAFLLYAGKLTSIDPTWIDQIFTAQHSDGGWSLDQKDPKSDNFATVLAMWALLEYNHSDVPYEPVIHHSN
jgi:hypothetical protein